MITVSKTRLPTINQYLKFLRKIWASGWVTNRGELSIRLEKKLEKHLRAKNLLVVGNGTLALLLAFKALGLKDEVITTPFTFPATTNSLLWEGLTPIFADINPETFNIDPIEVEKKITKKTTAILAVHVFGNPCEVEALEKIAKKHNLKLIYDAAHAFGVEYNNKSILDWGDVSILSFHAAKVFQTAEGGAVVAKDKKIYEKIDLMRNHGIQTYDVVVTPGINAKMNELEAAMGLSIIPGLKKELDGRRKIYKEYSFAFKDGSKFKLQKLAEKLTEYNYPYFPVCFSSESVRDRVYEVLLSNDIRARKYFYPPCHELPYLKSKSYNLPNATAISHKILCLPLYGSLALKDVKRIIKIVLQEA